MGEFRKQIDLIAWPQDTPSYGFDSEHRKLKMSETLDIVDKARKEYHAITHKNALELGYKREKWFERWFGK